MTIDIVLLHPKSNGLIQLKSSDPSQSVTINANYLSDEENHDLNLLLHGYKQVVNIFFNQQPFDGIVTFGHLQPCNDPLIQNEMHSNDEILNQYIMNNIQTNNNQIGTDSIGLVVDSNLILRNTSNVRIVDSSVIPHHIPVSGSLSNGRFYS